MTNHVELRAAAELASLRGIPVSVLPSDLTAILDELDAFKATARQKGKRMDYPQAFEDTWALYPSERQGTKKAAYRAWAARIKSGVEPAEIQLGLQRYLAHAKATGKATQYLYLAATFFGPDEHFATQWAINQPKEKHGKFGKQDFSSGVGENGEF